MEEPRHINIAGYLDELGVSQGDTPAILFPDSRDGEGRTQYIQLSFAELSEESTILARGLRAMGLKQGDRAILMVKPSLDFFALTFALLKAGVVPVLIDPGIGLKHLKACIGEAEPRAFIGITKAVLAKKLLGWGRQSIEYLVTVGPRLLWGGATLKSVRKAGLESEEAIRLDQGLDEPAAIAFTSGSTGVPKGVVYTHGIFNAQLAMIRDTYEIVPGEVDLPTFPPFALFDPALGMTTIIPEMDPTKPAEVEPEKILEAIQRFEVTNMFGSPALVDRVGRYIEEKGVKLPSLKRVISAGAPVPAKALRRFSSGLNEESQIFTPYGATESLPVCSVGSHEVLRKDIQERSSQGAGICVGKAVEGMEVAVIGISDEVIEEWSDALLAPQGQVGEIVVKGGNVTQLYFNRGSSTALAKIKDGETCRHRMGDLGYFDDEGLLWFCGRKAHRVQTEENLLFSVKTEVVFNNHPAVYRTALVGVGEPEAKEPILVVELEKENQSKAKQVEKELLELAASYPETQEIKRMLFHPSLPVDIRHNAKIFREKLALWAQGEIS